MNPRPSVQVCIILEQITMICGMQIIHEIIKFIHDSRIVCDWRPGLVTTLVMVTYIGDPVKRNLKKGSIWICAIIKVLKYRHVK